MVKSLASSITIDNSADDKVNNFDAGTTLKHFDKCWILASHFLKKSDAFLTRIANNSGATD